MPWQLHLERNHSKGFEGFKDDKNHPNEIHGAQHAVLPGVYGSNIFPFFSPQKGQRFESTHAFAFLDFLPLTFPTGTPLALGLGFAVGVFAPEPEGTAPLPPSRQ